MNKRLPLVAEGRYIQFRTELFNARNRTQICKPFHGRGFDAEGRQIDSNLGAFSSVRPARIIQLSVKIVF